MTLASDRLFRVLLLIVCVGLWVVALPTFALGIVGRAVTRDVATAGSVSVAVVFHTLSVILFGSRFGRLAWSVPGELCEHIHDDVNR